LPCIDRVIVALSLVQSFSIPNRSIRTTDQEVTGSTPVGRATKRVFFFKSLRVTFAHMHHCLGLPGLLAVAVEERHVDPATFVGVLKLDDVGFVEQVGIEDHGSVLPVRNVDRVRSAFF